MKFGVGAEVFLVLVVKFVKFFLGGEEEKHSVSEIW